MSMAGLAEDEGTEWCNCQVDLQPMVANTRTFA